MENAPVITLNGFSPYPGADPELWERYKKWGSEVYAPIMMKYPARRGIDSYELIKGNPLYPLQLTIHHHETLTTQQQTRTWPEQIAIQNDSFSWTERKVMDFIWSAIYELERSFRSEPFLTVDKTDTRIQNAPIINLEAFRLSPEVQDTYNRWFAEYGMNIFIPLYLKQSGVKGYDYYKYTGIQVANNAREPDYPAYLSVIYFEDRDDFAKYENSPELTTFQRTLRNVFPGGLNYRWYVEYQLTWSQRK